MTISAAATFAALHRADTGFIMPNAWDAGSAILLAAAGFPAIATTSAGIAFSLGRQDYAVGDGRSAVTRHTMLERARDIGRAVDVPVNADLEAGYGDDPESVATTVRAALEAGLAGANIEDRIPFEEGLYDEGLAVERIQAARAAIDELHSPFVLTARCDAIIWDEHGLETAIRRSNRYREAGADCLFTPGVTDLPTIGLLVREIAGPLNLVMGLNGAVGNARAWLDAGVQRISLGGSLARTAYGGLFRAATELAASGTIEFARQQLPQAELNALFARHARRV